MFNYYKKLFMLTLRSEFSAENQGGIDLSRPEEKKDITISDFKKLIKEYGEDGVINSEELNNLNDEINSIEGETKSKLQNLLDDVTKNISFVPSEKNILSGKVSSVGANISVEKEFNMFNGDNIVQKPAVVTPIEGGTIKTSKQSITQKQSVEKKKETPEDWIERKYNKPEQISKLKTNFGLEEKVSITDLVNAVKKFQKEHNLTQDGKPGKNTIQIITELNKQKKDKDLVENTKQTLDVTELSPDQITEELQKYTLATKKPLEALTPEEQKTILEAINSGGDLPVRDGTVALKNMESNRKVIGVIDLPAINGDVNGTYDKSQISSSLITKEENIVIKSGIATGIPESINEEGYYKVEKAGEIVVVTGERLKKMFKKENKAEQVKKELNIDDLGIEFSKLNINVKKENIRIEGGKYIIDIDGVGYNITLEPIGNDKFKMTDNSDNISDIIISRGEIAKATTLLNDLVQTKFMHKAYEKSHKLGGNLTSEGKKIKNLIDSVRTPSNLSEFKKKIDALRKEVFPKEKK